MIMPLNIRNICDSVFSIFLLFHQFYVRARTILPQFFIIIKIFVLKVKIELLMGFFYELMIEIILNAFGNPYPFLTC